MDGNGAPRDASGALRADTYGDFRARLAASGCALCPELSAGRTSIVVDRGNPGAKIMVIGEAPGETEDREGRAFVGRAGRLLDQAMAAEGFDTNRDVLIANVVKCRPPGNRPPKPAEAANCFPYLRWQLDRVRPRLVVLLGATAARHFLKDRMKSAPMKDAVGRFFRLPEEPGIDFLLLYHPAFLLRDPRKMADMREHLRRMRAFVDKEVQCIR